MRADLHAEITRRLVADYGFKVRGKWLQKGKCPECEQKELYVREENPWLIRCGRTNRCGLERHIKDLYPDLFEHWSERHPQTDKHPHAAADAYLQYGRGFDLKRLRGLYAQEYYRDGQRKIGTATVRFPLACGSWWERLIDQPERFGSMKARFAPGKSRAGYWWKMPDSPEDTDTLWLAEGIFDAIALESNGIAARALLSSNSYPAQELDALAKACAAAGRLRPTLVWALDNDASGRSFTRKWVERARSEGWDCKVAQIPQQGRKKIDWNDLHQRGKLGEADREEYLYHGALLIAESAVAKALLIYKRRERHEFHFGFDKRLFWFRFDEARYAKAKEALEHKDTGMMEDEIRDQALLESGSVSEIANCYPSVLYYQANKITDEAWYYCRIESPYFHKPVKNTFTAGQRSVAAEFKKRLMHVAPGAVWTGSQHQLDRILRDTAKVLTVETIDYIGYSREHRCYVFGDLAMQDGKLSTLNDDDYFELGNLSIKTLSQSVTLTINSNRSDYRCDWVDLIWNCFGAKGIVTLAFWFGSLFAEQIRETDKSFPFLEVIGEAGAGKSTLIEFMWKLFGRNDYEGFDPNKSTHAARARNFAQVSGLPVVLIESDREEDTSKAKAFDWNELKTAYNGRSVRSRGMKNSGNETYEPPFRGSIVIAQNDPVNASDAILQRIVHVAFDKSGHTIITKPLAEKLERMPMEQVSGFILAATSREKAVLEVLAEKRGAYENQLLELPDIKSVRIAKNHAQMMALVDALRPLARLTDEQHAATHAMLVEMAKQRQQAINADHPHVDSFWEQFEHLDGRQVGADKTIELDHSRDDSLIAVSLVEYEAACTRVGIRPPCDMAELKRLLRTSRRRQFLAVKTVNSTLTNRSVKCWVFQMER